MKKLLALALLAVGFAAVQAADAIFRVDVNGVKDKIAFTIHQEDDDMKGTPQGWIKQDKECTITYWALKKIGSTEWKDYEISFTPKKSGTVHISVGGQYDNIPANRAWLLVNKVEMNDKLYPNGDFTKTYKTKDGRVIPNGFWISGTDGAPDWQEQVQHVAAIMIRLYLFILVVKIYNILFSPARIEAYDVVPLGFEANFPS